MCQPNDENVLLPFLEKTLSNLYVYCIFILNERMLLKNSAVVLQVKDEGKSTAGGGKKGKGAATAPPFSEVCEHIRQALASPAGLTPDLDARLIKYYLLKKKREHLTKKEAERKAKDESSAPKSGRESSKGTKSVAAKGAKGSPKKGVAEAKESDVPMPTKAESKMKKRGEGEDLFTSIGESRESQYGS